MWVFERESLVHVMWPVLKLFQPEQAEIHYRVSSRNITRSRNLHQKFIRKRLIGLGYSYEEFVSFYDEYFGRTFFHLNIEKISSSPIRISLIAFSFGLALSSWPGESGRVNARPAMNTCVYVSRCRRSPCPWPPWGCGPSSAAGTSPSPRPTWPGRTISASSFPPSGLPVPRRPPRLLLAEGRLLADRLQTLVLGAVVHRLGAAGMAGRFFQEIRLSSPSTGWPSRPSSPPSGCCPGVERTAETPEPRAGRSFQQGLFFRVENKYLSRQEIADPDAVPGAGPDPAEIVDAVPELAAHEKGTVVAGEAGFPVGILFAVPQGEFRRRRIKGE